MVTDGCGFDDDSDMTYLSTTGANVARLLVLRCELLFGVSMV